MHGILIYSVCSIFVYSFFFRVFSFDSNTENVINIKDFIRNARAIATILLEKHIAGSGILTMVNKLGKQ